MNKKAFTLLELLVVITVVGVLLAFFGSAIGRVREMSRRALCANNLRQHGIAWYLYLDDSNGLFPAFHDAGSAGTDRAMEFTFGGKNGQIGDDPQYAFDKRVLNRYLDINDNSSHAVETFNCLDDKEPNSAFTDPAATNFEFWGNSYMCNAWWILSYQGNNGKRRPLSTITSPASKIWLEHCNDENVPGHGGRGGEYPSTPCMVLFLDGHIGGPFKWDNDFEYYDPNTDKPVLSDVNGTADRED